MESLVVVNIPGAFALQTKFLFVIPTLEFDEYFIKPQ